jgi:hypothetical protein
MECVVLSKPVSVAKQVLAWAMWKMKTLPHSNSEDSNDPDDNAQLAEVQHQIAFNISWSKLPSIITHL